MKPEEILNLKFKPQDLNTEISIRAYFKKLLETLWREGQRFSGKRPFGNSGWEYDVYTCLLKNGIITGKLDEDGYIEELINFKRDIEFKIDEKQKEFDELATKALYGLHGIKIY